MSCGSSATIEKRISPRMDGQMDIWKAGPSYSELWSLFSFESWQLRSRANLGPFSGPLLSYYKSSDNHNLASVKDTFIAFHFPPPISDPSYEIKRQIIPGPGCLCYTVGQQVYLIKWPPSGCFRFLYVLLIALRMRLTWIHREGGDG